MPLQVSHLLWRAGRAGTHIGTLCNLIYSQLGEVGIRRILGVLSLAKKFGTAAVEDACAAALEMGVHEYRKRSTNPPGRGKQPVLSIGMSGGRGMTSKIATGVVLFLSWADDSEGSPQWCAKAKAKVDKLICDGSKALFS
ncbi:MAG: hypothetical protein WCB11_09055 [Terriglobales bacterium]